MRLLNSNFIFFLFACICLLGCNTSQNGNAIPTEVNDSSDQKNVTSDSFDMLISDYENEDRVIWQKPGVVIDLLGDLTDKTVADLGAGSGYFAFRLLPSAQKVLALDIDPRAISYMDSIKSTLPEEIASKLELRLVGTENAGMKPAEVDAVLLVNTYMYLGDRVSYLSNLKEMIKAGGQIIIIDFKKKSMPIGPPLEEKVDLSVVESELKAAGFKIFSSNDTTLDYQYIIKATR
jgi:SAM-dependent methyltransferase